MPLPSGNLVTPVGERSDGTLRSLLIDDSDRLHVVDSFRSFTSALSLETADPTAPAGGNTLLSDTVPAGEVWHVLNVGALNLVSNYTRIRLHAVIDTIGQPLLDNANPTANNWDIWHGEIVLSEGDGISGVFGGVTLNDSILIRVAGYITNVNVT